MNLLILAALVLPVGWIATLIMERDLRKVRARNFVIATAGAALGAGWLAPLLEVPAISEYGLSFAGALVSLLTALAALSLLALARRALRWRALARKIKAA